MNFSRLLMSKKKLNNNLKHQSIPKKLLINAYEKIIIKKIMMIFLICLKNYRILLVFFI